MHDIIDKYADRGFVVVSMYGDCKFNPLKELLKKRKKVVLEMCDTDSHVPASKQSNRFVEEQVRCIRCEMPFTHIPRRLTIEMV